MGKLMMENYNKGVKDHPSVLRDSVDALRNCVKDLYDLDEDNYQMIKILKQRAEEHAKQIKNLRTSTISIRAKHTGGILILGGLVWLARRIFKDQAREINELNERVRKLEGEDTSEESDG